MVMNITSLTGQGLRDWLIQRVSAIVLALFTVFILGFFILHQPLQFEAWQALFQLTWVRLFTLLALVSLLLHTWIGLWTVSTDYLTKLGIRLVFQVVVFLALLGLFFWGVLIVWGNT